MTGLNAATVKSGGAVIDTNGETITIAQWLLDGSGGGGLTKIGAGTLTLGGINTYTGNTTVNAGALTLAAGAQLKFNIGANGISNHLTGTGTATLDGNLEIDLSAADATNGNTWTLVNAATLAETYGPTFTVNGFTESANVWTKTVGAHMWTFTEATGVLTVGPASAYSTWADLNGLTGADRDTGADPDADGLDNIAEFYLDGNPNAFTGMPPVTDNGATVSITFSRRDDAEADVAAQILQISTNLGAWTDVAIPAASDTVGGVTFVVVENGSDPDTVTATVPKGSDPAKFLRIKVTE